jgi:hypothetical protein
LESVFEKFCSCCLIEAGNKLEQAEAIIWYHYKNSGVNEITLKQINEYFIEAHLPEINFSRIRNSFTKSKNVCHGKAEGTFRLSLGAIKAFDEQCAFVFEQKQDRQPIANISGTPFVCDKDIESARAMSDLYVILHCYENSARSLISKVLVSVFGDNWSDKALNSVQKGKIETRKLTEAKNKWLSTRDGSPLFYLDWSDLLSIIKKYEVNFLPYIGDIKFVELRFEELERVRNIIAHHGYITNQEDFHRVVLSFNDWCRQIK